MNDAQGTLTDRKPSRNPRRNGEKKRSPRPAGADTPIVPMTKAIAIANHELGEMAGCKLSDAAVMLVTLHVNTNQTVASLARQLKINRSNAYNLIASPSGQELIARLARALLGTAAATATRTLTQLCAHKDPYIAFQAAQDLMERAGLGHSQRTAPTTTNAFAFSFATKGKDEA